MSESPSNDAPNAPERCDVLVVGAGPAGCAAARVLARGGLDVLLVDRQALGRDKICGDGLIPDAHAALAKLGVLDRVLTRARCLNHVAFTSQRGRCIELPAQVAVLPRRELDLLLNQAAQELGARFWAGAHFEAPLLDAQQRVCGARLMIGGQPHEVESAWVVLATGAVPAALMAAGVCDRHTPSGVAMRAHIHAPDLAHKFHRLDIIWSRGVRPGYGWIFPLPGDCFNIGVGVTGGGAGQAGRGRNKKRNLRAMFDAFVAEHAPAAELISLGTMVADLKGAPLRFSLEGARWSRPGLLVTGEAAGSTYSLTGEGIGKALETGMLAAQAILERAGDAATRARYEQSLAALKPRFEMYAKANRVNTHPWIGDLLIRRAQSSTRLQERMRGVLDETSDPGNLVSLRSLARLVLG